MLQFERAFPDKEAQLCVGCLSGKRSTAACNILEASAPRAAISAAGCGMFCHCWAAPAAGDRPSQRHPPPSTLPSSSPAAACAPRLPLPAAATRRSPALHPTRKQCCHAGGRVLEPDSCGWRLPGWVLHAAWAGAATAGAPATTCRADAAAVQRCRVPGRVHSCRLPAARTRQLLIAPLLLLWCCSVDRCRPAGGGLRRSCSQRFLQPAKASCCLACQLLCDMQWCVVQRSPAQCKISAQRASSKRRVTAR